MKIVNFILFQSALLMGIFHLNVIADERQQQSKKTYIVHMDKSTKPASFNDHFEWYDSSLRSVSDSADMLYTYKNAIHGFSTRLTKNEAELLAKKPGVVSVHPEAKYELHTTRTPEFLGLGKAEGVIPDSSNVSDVVVGVMDTGAWPESKCYDDAGLGPVPKRWKGECEVGKTFSASSCNKKLIGARFYSAGYEQALGIIDQKLESRSPRDDDGHGTHTSTTAAGAPVAGANLFGFAPGTARGMAPTARLAVYKVCWLGGCFGSDILAGIDQAIEDGVDIISMSLGGSLTDYYQDIVAIGAFAAESQGILVSVSAGNGGPDSGSLANVAPWMITVGAGTLDRDFPAYVTLGNGEKYKGISLYSGKSLPDELVPIVYGKTASNSSDGDLCVPGSLDPAKVAGKIVVCNRGGNSRAQKGQLVKDAGGVGMILTNTDIYGDEVVADAHVLPASAVGKKIGNLIKKYLSSAANPTGKISPASTQLGVKPAPVVASFSSRGPNLLTREILKPDLIAPGVNILAGWTGRVAPTGVSNDQRRASFNIISGTSMSCPHVSGLAALLKGAHPDWSPAAIRSALMTTSYSTYKDGKSLYDIATGNPANSFDYGAGHVNPVAALNPGLVYNATVDDYVSFLCALNYTASKIKSVTKRSYTCNATKKYSLLDFNYPSFAVPVETLSGAGGGADAPTTLKYTRTLTNVGPPGTYKVSVSSVTPSIKIVVQPETLSFSEVSEKKTYTVTFTVPSQPSGATAFTHLEWSDGKHVVRSPIAFSWT